MWQGCGERGTLLCCWLGYKSVQPLWRTIWRLLKQVKNRSTLWPSNSTSGYLSKTPKMLILKDTWSPPIIAVIPTLTTLWKQPKCPLIDQWRKRCGACVQWNITRPWKRMEACHLWQHGCTQGYHTKWNESDRQRQVPYDFSYMWHVENKTSKTETNS